VKRLRMEDLLKFPFTRTVVAVWKFITGDEIFWKAVIVSRLISLKFRGVNIENFRKMAKDFGKAKKSEIILKYAVSYFIKAVAEDLFSGIIVAGIVDIFLNLPLETFVLELFLLTFLFAVLDTIAFLKIEFSAMRYRDEILEIVERLYQEDVVPDFSYIRKITERKERV